MATSSILPELQWRGLVADMANRDELEKLLAPGAAPVTIYVGFDPTSSSLQLGNLIGLVMLRRFQLAGHKPIILAGGATGMIGDPGGKSAERNLLSKETIDANIASTMGQLTHLLDFESATNPAVLVNNADWMQPMGVLDFLRDVGKHFTINAMVAKDSVKSRMDRGGRSPEKAKVLEEVSNRVRAVFHGVEEKLGLTSELQILEYEKLRAAVEWEIRADVDPVDSGQEVAGISFTEFSYSLLQAYDFLHLFQSHGCQLQGGGADQWGNIVAGTDLIRRKLGAVACGLTWPLITKADGTKFGKTEDGAVWLSAERTSVYRFYQFLIQVEDTEVINLLKFFTFLPLEDIDALAAQHAATPERRDAHKKLAFELTKLVHGETATADAIRASEILFGGSLEGITDAQFDEVIAEVPNGTLSKQILGQPEGSLIDVLIAAKLCPSKGQARKDIEANGINVNNVRATDIKLVLRAEHLLFGKFVLLRKGKRNYALVRFE
jgi:tyrosyl-tRNA synthetase